MSEAKAERLAELLQFLTHEWQGVQLFSLPLGGTGAASETQVDQLDPKVHLPPMYNARRSVWKLLQVPLGSSTRLVMQLPRPPSINSINNFTQ